METLPTTRHLIDSAPEMLDHRIRVEISDFPLWEKFYQVWNEMIITRQGRKMFPVLKINISGLEQAGMYAVILQFEQVSSQRWKYLNGEWSSGGRSETMAQKNFYYHPDSPNYGFHWMRSQVTFHKMKLSNKECGSHQVRLNSLHKYEPVLKIFKIEANSMHLVHKQTFHVCQFIAVTAYQNEKVTSLKIQFNPYAKSFLEARERNMRNEYVESSFEQQKENVQQNYYMLLNHENNRMYAQQHLINIQRGGSSANGMPCYGMNNFYPRRPIPYPSPSPNAQFNHQGYQQQFNNDAVSGSSNEQQGNHYHQNYYSGIQMQPNIQKLHKDLALSYSNIHDYRNSMNSNGMNNNNQQTFSYNNYISQQYPQNGNLNAVYNHFTQVPFTNQSYNGLYQGSKSLKGDHDALDSSGGSPENSLDLSECSIDDSSGTNDNIEWPTTYFNSDSSQQGFTNDVFQNHENKYCKVYA